MLTPINVAINTDKFKAEVILIHSSCVLSLEGYAALVHLILMKHLPLARYLAIDSRSFIQYVGKHAVPDGATLSTWNIEDFYMQGDHECLIELVCRIIHDENEKKLVRNLLWLALSNQYTRAGVLSLSVYAGVDVLIGPAPKLRRALVGH
jgi:hypothetical protein